MCFETGNDMLAYIIFEHAGWDCFIAAWLVDRVGGRGALHQLGLVACNCFKPLRSRGFWCLPVEGLCLTMAS